MKIEVNESVRVSLFTLDWLRRTLLMDWMDGYQVQTVIDAIFQKELYDIEPDMEEWTEEEKIFYHRYLDDNTELPF